MEPVKNGNHHEKEKEKHKSKDIYKHVRPNLVKLFSHLILLYLSIKGYNTFLDTKELFADFIDDIDDPILLDLKMINSASSCPPNYTDIETTSFPKIRSGCRCDNKYFIDEICPNIEAIARKTGNENSWKTSCSVSDSVLSKGRLLQSSNNSFNHQKNLPNKCDCYQKIEGVPAKNIDTWFKNKKFCILKDPNITTLTYLSSALYDDGCLQENLCQTYFCKNKFTDDVSKPCPVVDIYFDQIFSRIEGNKVVQYVNNSDWNLHADSYYQQMFVSNETFENTILPPTIGISITRSGKCVSGENSFFSDNPLFEKVECPIDQKYYSISKLTLQEVLSNNNYLNEVLKVPGISKTLTNDNKWSLDAQYGFNKFTLTCLLNNYDKLNSNDLQSLNDTQLSDFDYKQKKIGYILKGFIQFTTEFDFQEHLQRTILGINVTLVFGTVITVIYKIFSLCFNCKCCHGLFSLEIYFSFSIEFILGTLGAVSYFILGDFIDFLDSLLTSNCVDNYVQYKFGVFHENLEGTSDRNLEVFLIVVLKISLILVSIVYYSCSLDKITCKHVIDIIKEGIGEGEGEEEEELEHDHEEGHELKNIHDENQTPSSDEKKNKVKHHVLGSQDPPVLFEKKENNGEVKELALPVDENKKSGELPMKSDYE